MEQLKIPMPVDGVQVVIIREGGGWCVKRSTHRPGDGWTETEVYPRLLWSEAEDLVLVLIATALD